MPEIPSSILQEIAYKSGLPHAESLPELKNVLEPEDFQEVQTVTNKVLDREGIAQEERPDWVTEGISFSEKQTIGNNKSEVEKMAEKNGYRMVIGKDLSDLQKVLGQGVNLHNVPIVGGGIDTKGYYVNKGICEPIFSQGYTFTDPKVPAIVYQNGAGHCGLLFIRDETGRVFTGHKPFFAESREFQTQQYAGISQFVKSNMDSAPMALISGVNIFTINDKNGQRDNFVRRFHNFFQESLSAVTCHLISKPEPSNMFRQYNGFDYDPNLHKLYTHDLGVDAIEGFIYIPKQFTRSSEDTLFFISDQMRDAGADADAIEHILGIEKGFSLKRLIFELQRLLVK